MASIHKWNYSAQQYEHYPVPDYAVLAFYHEDMEQYIHCAGCFKPIKYGDCYTSRVLYTETGFGYAVCPECYQRETLRRKRY